MSEGLGIESAQELLQAAYKKLGYVDGMLFNATDSPKGIEPDDWINKGEWLCLAKKVNAEKVFFVDNNPIIVFAQCPSEKEQLRFQEIWNMARPPLLFLASPGELGVYDLTHGPAESPEDWGQSLSKRRLQRATKIAEVAEKLQQFRREQIESGRLFEDVSFGDDCRADKALIADLQIVRQRLMEHRNLKPKYAHSLIGRSIFIRYLEDREVLVPDYFKRVARGNAEWRKMLNKPLPGVFVEEDLSKRLYLRVLQSKDFTYALFNQLAKDFNGDMFPEDEGEEKAVTQTHVDLLRRFLCGDADPDHPRLFFFAYKFDIIPIELISSIYEEFYSIEKPRLGDRGSHYTPPALVEFLLSQVLTLDRLCEAPRILDPACGSGIFLVESFRRIVRYRVQTQGKHLNRDQLLKILRKQIAGVDINEEAVRVAAFSLYLAFLHYQRPPDILAQIKAKKLLPNLKYEVRRIRKQNLYFDTLLVANSFDVSSIISPSDTHVAERFSAKCADIIVGNPPWGSPGNREEEQEWRQAMDVALKWCHAQEPQANVGDREWSQAFIHRVVHLLRDGGCAGLLVSAGVLFKSHEKSQAFRKQWLTSTVLHRIVNFSHVRDVFFKGKARQTGVQSPFISVVFSRQLPSRNASLFEYWSAKKTAMVNETQAVVLSRTDLRRLSQRDVLLNENIWKIHWWGTHRDSALIEALQTESPLGELKIHNSTFSEDDFGRGFERKGDKNPAPELQEYPELPTRVFVRYGPIDRRQLIQSPKIVHRKGNLNLYSGLRLLVKRGITEKGVEKGRITARLATQSFCFRNSIHGVRVPECAEREGKILLGIFWSSLARYYYWLTAGSWMWHNEIHLEDVRRMPICLPKNRSLTERIVSIVEELMTLPSSEDLFHGGCRLDGVAKLEGNLDDAIFDLYGLSSAERDQVRDMCKYGLDLFYRHVDSEALKCVEEVSRTNRFGVYSDITSVRAYQQGLDGYLRAFLEMWNRELEPGGEFRWEVIRPGVQIPMLAVIFATQEKNKPFQGIAESDIDEWGKVLSKLERSLATPFGSKRIYIDGVVRSVTDTEIMIIKRNERRLWTRSMAREDAEATLLQAIHLQKAKVRT